MFVNFQSVSETDVYKTDLFVFCWMMSKPISSFLPWEYEVTNRHLNSNGYFQESYKNFDILSESKPTRGKSRGLNFNIWREVSQAVIIPRRAGLVGRQAVISILGKTLHEQTKKQCQFEFWFPKM